jgi:membrane protease subunit (stomatin/prohibitin family)
MKPVDIIKYEGDNKTFIWKHPKENFTTGTQLIVNESQEAIFFMNGQALDLFGPGRHTLETQNIPLIRKFFKKAINDETPFHCKIYFINKTEQMAIKWGTDSRVQYIEPTYNFPLSIGASGEMSLKIENSRKTLVNLVGTESNLSQTKLVSMFRAILMTKVKSYIAKIMKTNKINIFEVDEMLENFSKELKLSLMEDFKEYGLSLERFFVTTVSKPEGDSQYEKFKELYFRQYADVADAKLRQQVDIIDQQTESQKIIMESQAIARKREQEGYSFQEERSFDVSEEIAKNEAKGEFTNMGIGMGMIAGVGGTVGGQVGGMLNQSLENITNNDQQKQNKKHNEIKNNEPHPKAFCENCGKEVNPNDKFCQECGSPINQSKPKCSNCGYEFERNGKFCPKCGTKRED